MLFQLLNKIKFDLSADRLGPDIPFTHWKLHFKTLSKSICKSKFALFSSGAQFRAGAYAITCSKIHLGKNVVIRPGSMLFADPRKEELGYIYIEDNVMLGSNVHIYVSNHRFDSVEKEIILQGHYDPQDVTIKQGAWIGANVTILPGVTIGQNTVIGAGSVVTKSIEDFCLAVGNPAKIIKKLKVKAC